MIALKSERAKAILDGVLTLPLVLPPTVAGFFLLYIFGVKRPIGKLLLAVFSYKIVFTWQATVLAAAVISFPLMYRSARGAFELVDENVLNAARTLGLPERKVFWKILMPMAMPGVLSGGVLAFARGLGEFGATAMIAGNIAGKDSDAASPSTRRWRRGHGGGGEIRGYHRRHFPADRGRYERGATGKKKYL